MSALDSVDGRHPLFYLHIPKTAGTSVTEMLTSRLALAGWELQPAGAPVSPTAGAQDRRIFRGHSGLADFKRVPPLGNCFTILRDPIERALSTYYYARAVDPGPGDWFSECSAAAKQKSLREIMESDDPRLLRHYSNVQTRFLSASSRSAEVVGVSHFQEARTALEQLLYVGLTERLEESMDRFCRLFGVPPCLGTATANRNASRPAVSGLEAGVRDRLRELNEFDFQIYATALKRFEREEPASGRPVGALVVPKTRSSELVLNLSELVLGTEWYRAETTPGGRHIWSGPGTESSLYLAVENDSDKELMLTTPGLLSGDNDRIRLAWNGSPLACGRTSENFLLKFSAHIPRNAIPPNGFSVLTFSTPQTTRPCDLDASNHDSRQLGLMLVGLEIRNTGSTRPGEKAGSSR